MVLYFVGVYMITTAIHDRLEIRDFSSRVKKYFPTKRNFVSQRDRVIQTNPTEFLNSQDKFVRQTTILSYLKRSENVVTLPKGAQTTPASLLCSQFCFPQPL